MTNLQSDKQPPGPDGATKPASEARPYGPRGMPPGPLLQPKIEAAGAPAKPPICGHGRASFAANLWSQENVETENLVVVYPLCFMIYQQTRLGADKQPQENRNQRGSKPAHYGHSGGQ